MTNLKNTKRALLASVIALFLCCAMLVGTTFAWFTDSVSSANNIIQTGSLKVDLEHLVEGNWVSLKDNPEHKVFNYSKWEPGFTQVETLKITNEGTLALQYQLSAAIAAGTAIVGANGEKLSDVIDVYMCFGESTATSVEDLADTSKWWSMGTLTEVMAQNCITNGKLLPVGAEYEGELLGENGVAIGEITASIALHMQETAGNEYQNLSLGDISLTLMATQFAYEEDSFGNQYDQYAAVSSVAEMKEALAKGITEFNFMGSTINLNYGITKAMVPAGTTITIKNAKVSGKSYGNGVDGTVIFENCTFTNTGAYSIHFDNGAGDVVFKNCVLYGWNSFGSSLNSVSFYDSALIGNGTYALIRSYVDLYLENCTYDISNANHEDVYSEGIEALNDAKLEMVNCSQILSSAEDFIGATEGGDISITEDIVYNNTDPEKQMILQADNAINFNGNGNTIVTEGADPSIGNHGYVAFVPPAGEDVTVSDLTVTGTGFVELGHWGLGDGNYVANNLVVKDLVSTLANGDKGKTLACGFSHYGNAILNDCVMTGTTALIEGAMAVDAGFVNGTTTVVNGGEYGVVYCWSQAEVTLNGAEVDTLYVAPIKGTVTIGAGTHVATLNIDYGTSAANADRLAKIVIEEGAIIDAVVFEGVTYTLEEWLAR
jgi:predicted ribosomally synthesized peptide with SipW-like signal peptide